jgi:hypothetical protein
LWTAQLPPVWYAGLISSMQMTIPMPALALSLRRLHLCHFHHPTQ